MTVAMPMIMTDTEADTNKGTVVDTDTTSAERKPITTVGSAADLVLCVHQQHQRGHSIVETGMP